MISLREEWAASFHPPMELWRRQYHNATDTALFVSKPGITLRVNEDPFGRSPVYHVWQGDKWLYCGQNHQAAYAKYGDAVRKKEALTDQWPK